MTNLNGHLPPGPWVDEPDRVEWRHRGLPCLITRQPEQGHLCGYVAVPPGHPWHGVHYRELSEVYVHGGLTYADPCFENVCHVPQQGEPDNVWWFGFDCAHYGDLPPYQLAHHLEAARRLLLPDHQRPLMQRLIRKSDRQARNLRRLGRKGKPRRRLMWINAADRSYGAIARLVGGWQNVATWMLSEQAIGHAKRAPHLRDAVYRDIAYVRAEVERLADQVAAHG